MLQHVVFTIMKKDILRGRAVWKLIGFKSDSRYNNLAHISFDILKHYLACNVYHNVEKIYSKAANVGVRGGLLPHDIRKDYIAGSSPALGA